MIYIHRFYDGHHKEAMGHKMTLDVNFAKQALQWSDKWKKDLKKVVWSPGCKCSWKPVEVATQDRTRCGYTLSVSVF